MSSWADRAKVHFAHLCQKPTPITPETHLLGVLGVPSGHMQEKTDSELDAVNDVAPDSDRWSWPHSTAMNTVEIGTFTARLSRFTNKGLSIAESEDLADKLVNRDREHDDRHSCFECNHLAGDGGWHCGNWQRAGVAVRARDAELPIDLVNLLKRCDGFTQAIHFQKQTGGLNGKTQAN